MAILENEKKLRSEIERLKKGEYATPVSCENTGILRSSFAALESLRLSLLVKEHDKNEQKEQMNSTVSSVTHDLKTPIAMIAGYAECLGDGMDDRDYPALIRDKAMDMNDTVLKIIDGAKSTLSDIKKSYKLLSVRELFERIMNGLAPVVKENGITLKVSRMPKIYLYAVEADIASVMQNLLSNAVKHTKKGGTIFVKFALHGRKLVIKVKDSGSGISAADLPHIFEKYYTEDKARTHGGTGLGLSIAKAAVEAHGGTITAKSKEGKGATFIVTLPAYSKRRFELITEESGKTRCNKWVAWGLCLVLGIFGAHKFYEKNIKLGLLYIFTGGLFIFGYLADIIIYLTSPNPYYV